MRATSAKAAKKPVKNVGQVPASVKKKRMFRLRTPLKDTVAETISFVIQGKLTPIKPTPILLSEVPKKRIYTKSKPNEPKVKSKNLRKTRTVKTTAVKKDVKTRAKLSKNKTPKKKSPVAKSQEVKPKRTVAPKVKPEPKVAKSNEKLKLESRALDDEIKKQKTIEKLLKEANKAIKSKSLTIKTTAKRKSTKIKQAEKAKTKELFPNQLTEVPIELVEIKKEIVDWNLKNPEEMVTETAPVAEVETLNTEKSIKVENQEINLEPNLNKPKPAPTPTKKTNKKAIIKKRLNAKKVQIKNKMREEKRKAQLYNFWNGPKRHRVASLNALAKVHCLYENESKITIFDKIDEATVLPKKEVAIKKELIENEPNSSGTSEATYDVEVEDIKPTRTLRCAPGLRAVGKHWDMHDTSSSEENSDCEQFRRKSVPSTVKKEYKKKETKKKEKQENVDTAKSTETKRKRNRTELVMDLKDMVVRKRMASLNATAILAASYSVEKRAVKTRSDDSSEYDTDSSEDYFAASDPDDSKKSKLEEESIKDEDRKLIEVHTTPNKKVAVILNQDTDVTITGVYVNSTTRSTHHEGYCSIAGMQYRISATSHTQTAATAVATETLLQSTSAGPDNSNSDSQPSSKSYTPLDALTNMQPPPGPGIQHNHHVLPMPPHQMSPGVRHGCSSAFSSPHVTPSYPPPPPPPGHHHGSGKPGEPPTGYVHGYYQPAGPLITVPHGHAQPVPPPKSVPSSDASPTPTTPPLQPHQPPPPPSSNGGDSSDSEVIITSVTAGTKEPHPPPSAHPQYRYAPYSTAPPPGYTYSYPPPYHYTTQPPPNPQFAHHDLCYPANSYVHPKYTSYRTRYLTSGPYYSGNPQELYPPPPSGPSQTSQQEMVTTSGSSNGTAFAQAPGGPPPPPTLIETYPAPPPPTLVETYQPPPHYYPPTYSLPPSCYTHPPARGMPYINPTYQSCPCPMQSCPKNVLTGPLTGDSKRPNNMASISKDSMPLPPVALALPLEPASATGPPSPARGSAGMPPPPSPAGATYQPPPPAPKQESHSPEVEDCKVEKKRKARVGKAMVRMQNTMLLMCNPNQNCVKREIESPKEKELVEVQKKEVCSSDEENKTPTEEDIPIIAEDHAPCIPKNEMKEDAILEPVPEPEIVDNHAEEKLIVPEIIVEKAIPQEEPLPPCIATVAENVKVKNMKRKQSMSKEIVPDEISPPSAKKKKLGSYKDFIKKQQTNCIKIDNGRRKLINKSANRASLQTMRLKPMQNKRKINIKDQHTNKKRMRLSSKIIQNGLHKTKNQQKEETSKKTACFKKRPFVGKTNKSAVKVLDKLFAKNNVDRIIESVVSDSIRTSDQKPCAKRRKSVTKNGQVKVTETDQIKITTKSRRKPLKVKEIIPEVAVVPKIPRRSLQTPRWSNGWTWEGEPYEGKVFLNSDETTVVRKCYPAMRHIEGDQILPRDCVLLKAGPRKNDLPYVAKIAYLWENPEDGEMMMSLLWYYRPEHTEQGRLPVDQPDEVFASRHKDSNSVACIDDKCYVLTFNEYCRHRKRYKRLEEGIEEMLPCIPIPEPYPRCNRQPPGSNVAPEMVFFCRKVYDYRQKRIIKNPT